ncbi:MAG: hypothetical protein EP335_17750 [Alphaproteobacteria bacterium]|nr:MAG: hypothetical protein EP335_17750 [Alphaproteobacteria bacterium]
MHAFKLPALAAAFFVMTPVTYVPATALQEVGSSLNHKAMVPIAEVPVEVLTAAKLKRPGMTFEKAEEEKKGGNHYFDIEGKDADGNEIELDMVLTDTGWQVVEIQRDLAWDDVPAAVRETLTAHVPGVQPARIIESDQDNGTIIYEFFTRDAHGKEAKYEVKLTGGETEFLKDEWQH